MSQIIVRPFQPLLDSGFIFSTMPKAVFYAAFHPLRIPNHDDFFKAFYPYLKELLATSQTSIACMLESPEIILGYMIKNDSKLEFIYVKDMFRNQGIATLLTKNKHLSSVNEDHLTKVGYDIICNHPDLFKTNNEAPVEPKKEEPNESTSESSN